MINLSEINFSKQEIERYSRHLILPEFNLEGQKRLKASRILVVGGGGLGSPVLQYFAAAGVGNIGIVDFDRVDESNLQRQVLYGQDSVGELKVEEAKKRVLSINPFIQVRTYNEMLTSANALEIIKDYDIVVDGTDNFPTRYLVNDACVLLDKVNVYASIFRFEGQVSVFNYKHKDGSYGPNYRDLFPSPPPPGMVPSCAEGGVLGVLPGIIGSMQALEAIKVASGVGEPLVGRLFLYDAFSFETRILKIRKDPSNPLTGEHPTQLELIDYDQFCGLKEEDLDAVVAEIKAISVLELESWKKSKKNYRLIDVREPYEYEIVNMGGELIPQSEIEENRIQISREMPIVFHCRSGKRSADVIRKLESQGQYDNLYNLKGGILAWIEELEPSLPRY